MIDNLIAAIAAKQHGNISRLQLLQLGLTEAMIDYRLKVGRPPRSSARNEAKVAHQSGQLGSPRPHPHPR